MKSLSAHFSVVLSLFVLLFSLQFYIMLDRVIVNYEQSISNSYSIVIVSNKDISKESVEKSVPNYSDLQELSPQKIIDRLQETLSKENLKEFRSQLPKFYKLVLSKLPNDRTLENIKTKLLKIDGIYRVESFSKTYSQIYKLLVISKNILAVMTLLVGIIGYLLIHKQIKIWNYEHRRRLSVMALFGAPFWMKSMTLYRQVFIDSMIASFLVALIFNFAPKVEFFQSLQQELGLEVASYSFIAHFSAMFIASFLVAFISVTAVVIEKNR
jgi:cell division transport system permease protein